MPPRNEQKHQGGAQQTIHFGSPLCIDLNVQGDSSVSALLQELIRKVETMSAALDRLSTEVGETKGVVDSAITLIEGLAQQIRDLAEDPAKLNALADELDSKTNALAAKVAENSTPPPTP